MRYVLAAAFLAATLTAQTPTPAFEAASVKVNQATNSVVRVSTFPNRFSGVNMTLRMLLGYAYGLEAYRMAGGPNWMDTDRFDVEATAGSDAGGFEMMRARMRALLADRFRLKTHTETRDQWVYVLTFAPCRRQAGRSDQTGRDRLSADQAPPGAPPPPPPPPGGAIQNAAQCPSMLGMGNISGRKITVDRLAATIATNVNRTVVNRTNLAGLFDIDLRWMPDYLPFIPPGAPPPPFDPTAPPLFTAVQEQLGLKLDSQRGPVELSSSTKRRNRPPIDRLVRRPI